MTVSLRPEAVADVRAARDLYQEAGADVGAAFREELDGLLARLEIFPRSARVVEGATGVRRAPLHRFPFAVFDVVTEQDDVVVLRVIHVARSTERWP